MLKKTWLSPKPLHLSFFVNMRLNIGDAFVGREKECETLKKIAQRVAAPVGRSRAKNEEDDDLDDDAAKKADKTTTATSTSASSEVCLVHGAAGSGKTKIISHSLRGAMAKKRRRRGGRSKDDDAGGDDRNRNRDDDGSYYFISGKCDQYQDFSSPYWEIVTAFDQLAMLAPPERIKKCIKETEARVLTRLIPSFQNVLLMDNDSSGESSGFLSSIENDTKHKISLSSKREERQIDFDSSQSSLTLASERLTVAFRVFLREFCSVDHPIIMLIDDLQVRKKQVQSWLAAYCILLLMNNLGPTVISLL